MHHHVGSPTARRRAAAVATIAAALALAACGGSTSATTTAAATTTTAAPSSTDATDAPASTHASASNSLQSLLLAASDLPSDWTITYSQPGDDFGSFGDSSCPGHAVDAAIVERVRPTVSATFGSADGSLLIEQAALQADPAQLEADLAAVMEVDSACFGLDSIEGEGGKTVFDRLTMPALADQQESATWRFLADPDGMATAMGHIAIVRVGPIAMEISQSESLSSPGASPTYTDEEFVALVQKAVARAKA